MAGMIALTRAARPGSCRRDGVVTVVATLSCLLVAASAAAADPPDYSPYAGARQPSRVYFGDTHLHTSFSTDAGMVGNRLGPEDGVPVRARRRVVSTTGMPAKLSARSISWWWPITRRDWASAPVLKGNPVVYARTRSVASWATPGKARRTAARPTNLAGGAGAGTNAQL